MKFKKSLITLLGLFVISGEAQHVSDRSIYATEVKNAAGTSVFNFPTSLAPAGTVAYFNSKFEPVGDANLVWDSTLKKFTLTKSGLASTPTSSIVVANETAATVGVQQASPAIEWLSRGWKTNPTAASQLVNFRAYALPIQAASNPDGVFKIQSSINGAPFSDLLDLYTKNPDSNQAGRMDFAGALKLSFNHSNQDPGTSRGIDLVNTAGTFSNLAFTFGSSQKAGITVDNSGVMSFKQINNSNGYMFMSGGAISGQSLMTQIYSGGVYTSGGGFFNGRVTAGNSDTTPPATLNSYGSTAVGYELVTAATKTLDATHTNIYCDPSTESCGGTPNQTACSTYSASGQATCESHLPCVYSAAITTQCSGANFTDSSTCTSQNAACSWESAACTIYNNNGSGCANAGFPSGGQCTFTPSSCSDFASTASCDAEVGNGCTTNKTSCNALSDGGGDGTACATQPECSYDNGSGTCSGDYFVSCSGSYGGSNGVCSGSYDTGNCTGSWISSPASCTGSVECSLYSSSGSCNGESGCIWQALTNITLPTTSSTLKGTTSRIYNIMHVGNSGTVEINANTGQDFLNYTNLKLRKKGDTAEIQLVSDTRSCSTISTESPCNAQSPCSWQAAIVCSSFGDQSTCESNSCSWDGFSCSGAGSPAQCTGGNYTAYNRWMPIKYQRSPNYVTKTAAYTLTNEDDIVEWTSGTVNATLPSAALTRPFQRFVLKNTGAGVITIVTTSGQTVDGNTSGSLTLTSDQSMTVISDGANWIRE